MRRIRKTTITDKGKPLSIRKMAEKLGTKPIALSRFETGKKSRFRHELVTEYAKVLGVPVDLFYTVSVHDTNEHMLDVNNRRYEELYRELKEIKKLKYKDDVKNAATILNLKKEIKTLKKRYKEATEG